MTVACILLPRQSTGHGNYLHEDKWFAADRQQDANAQSARKMLLDAFLRKILQETALLESTHAEENLLNLDDQNAIEETDQLTTITRYVGVGYNLLRGSPDGDFERGGVDPGILSTGVIFEFTYDKGKEAYLWTVLCKFLIRSISNPLQAALQGTSRVFTVEQRVIRNL